MNILFLNFMYMYLHLQIEQCIGQYYYIYISRKYEMKD